MVRASPFIHQPDQVALKASDVSEADWRYQTHVKNTIFFTCAVTAFLRAGNPFITRSLCDKTNIFPLLSLRIA